MFTKTAVAFLAAAGAASAAPAATNKYFGGLAIHSGSDIQNAGVSASKNSLWLNHAQDASCDKQGTDFATFYIQDGAAYLYSTSATPQQLYVDRSGMGRGNIGYTTGAQPTPKNSERTGFAVSESGYLTFDGSDAFYACPSTDGSYGIWQQQFSEDCVSFGFSAQYTDSPVGCSYSQQGQ
ncbi:cell wall protein [Diplodia corticola]|uniref:Cell wall protein n=1 Tax=Diplodia corticola TaxID=236234 RepID=A0A1J9RIF4_9PEZI|nr:cell wall protein [Diplodia corticola]OJD32339.1 cell wall protein [Diplodia corticola]